MNIHMAKKMARNGHTKVIYKGTFVSIQTLHTYSVIDLLVLCLLKKRMMDLNNSEVKKL